MRPDTTRRRAIAAISMGWLLLATLAGLALAAAGCADIRVDTPDYIGPAGGDEADTPDDDAPRTRQLPSSDDDPKDAAGLYRENQQLRDRLARLEQDRRQWQEAVDRREQTRDRLEDRKDDLED